MVGRECLVPCAWCHSCTRHKARGTHSYACIPRRPKVPHVPHQRPALDDRGDLRFSGRVVLVRAGGAGGQVPQPLRVERGAGGGDAGQARADHGPQREDPRGQSAGLFAHPRSVDHETDRARRRDAQGEADHVPGGGPRHDGAGHSGPPGQGEVHPDRASPRDRRGPESAAGRRDPGAGGRVPGAECRSGAAPQLPVRHDGRARDGLHRRDVGEGPRRAARPAAGGPRRQARRRADLRRVPPWPRRRAVLGVRQPRPPSRRVPPGAEGGRRRRQRLSHARLRAAAPRRTVLHRE